MIVSEERKKAVYVRYRDHVFFRNVAAPINQAIVREALGWIKEETDEAMLIECDKPLQQGCSGFNGVVILKNCIISMVELPLHSFFSEPLNCPTTKKKIEYCASSQRSEKLNSRGVTEH